MKPVPFKVKPAGQSFKSQRITAKLPNLTQLVIEASRSFERSLKRQPEPFKIGTQVTDELSVNTLSSSRLEVATEAGRKLAVAAKKHKLKSFIPASQMMMLVGCQVVDCNYVRLVSQYNIMRDEMMYRYSILGCR